MKSLIAASNLPYVLSCCMARTENAIGSFVNCSAAKLLQAVLAAEATPVDEPGVRSPAVAFELTLPMKGVIGIVQMSDLDGISPDSIQWLDPKGTAGTILGGALPCVPVDLVPESVLAKLATTNRFVVLAGPRDDGAGNEFWAIFPSVKGMVVPEPQPKELTLDSWVKIIW